MTKTRGRVSFKYLAKQEQLGKITSGIFAIFFTGLGAKVCPNLKENERGEGVGERFGKRCSNRPLVIE